MPDATDAYDTKEKNEPFAIVPNNIDANKYYLPNNPLPISLLQEKAKVYEKEDAYFSTISAYINKKKMNRKKEDFSLKLDDLLKILPTETSNEDDDDETEFTEPKKADEFYKVVLNNYENERVKSDSYLKNTEDNFKKYLSKDPYLKITYRLMTLMTK